MVSCSISRNTERQEGRQEDACSSVKTVGDIFLGQISAAHGPHTRALNYPPKPGAFSTRHRKDGSVSQR